MDRREDPLHLAEVLQRHADTVGDGMDGIFGKDDRLAQHVRQLPGQAAQQRTAAGEDDAVIDDVA